MLGAWFERSRPSHCRTVALGMIQFAANTPPGLLWNVPLIRTSTFGMVYELAPVTRVVMPGPLWQYGFNRLISGSFARISQLSVTVSPVLLPAWNCTPLRSLALRLSSRPL